MDILEQVEKVKKYELTKKNWRSKLDSLEFNEASSLNYKLFGKHLNGSANCECIEDLFLFLNDKNFIEKITKKMEKVFKLKEGVGIIATANYGVISQNTEDITIQRFLTDHPNMANHFEELPDGWEDMDFSNEAENEVVDNGFSDDELAELEKLRAEYLEATGKKPHHNLGKDKLIEGIEKSKNQ